MHHMYVCQIILIEVKKEQETWLAKQLNGWNQSHNVNNVIHYLQNMTPDVCVDADNVTKWGKSTNTSKEGQCLNSDWPLFALNVSVYLLCINEQATLQLKSILILKQLEK